ncbi:HD domain-containing protein [Candidatus Daviesbacteria bacterium]|nr:HD domain-containing protein [Candidatus Daviesbacteria bacterium]
MDRIEQNEAGLEKSQQMLELIKHYHEGQFRSNGKVPYWHHSQSVAEIMLDAIKQSGEFEGEEGKVEQLFLAAQGHDLYEDTDIDPDEIKEKFGVEIHDLIQGLTNEHGDHDRAGYIEKLINASEEVRLIKFADMVDNTVGCAYNIFDLGVEWVKGFFLPIISEQREKLADLTFTKYPRTATLLKSQFDFSYQRLQQNLAKYE